MFLRDKLIVRTIEVPAGQTSETLIRVPVKKLGLDETEAKSANVVFAAEVGDNGIIVHATQITWAFDTVGGEYCLVGTANNNDLDPEETYVVFIQVEATIGEITAEAYTVA